MGTNVDEDLIEATIRRVAEAKAAAESGSAEARPTVDEAADSAKPASSGDQPGDSKQQPSNNSEPPADDDAIAATIARVAAAKAAREQSGDETTSASEDTDAAAQTTDSTRPAVDDDAIEATIARVAAAKAMQPEAESVQAHADDAGQNATSGGSLRDAMATRSAGETRARPKAVPSINEDAIEATIRRVAEAKARASAGADPADTTSQGDENAGDDSEPPPPDNAPVRMTPDPVAASSVTTDESAIEATIRRVAEAKARASAGAGPGDTTSQADENADDDSERRLPDNAPVRMTPDPVAASSVTTDESAIEATIRRVAEARAARQHQAPDVAQPARPAALAKSPTPIQGDEWRETTDRLEREIATINRAIAVLTHQVDGLLSEFERISTAAAQVPPDRIHIADRDEDEWDEPPVISRLPSSMPPRPAIFRDLPEPAAPVEATTAPPDDEEEEAAEAAPEPPRITPAMPATEPKLNFELLPRTYRITVEDKRRSVDLVPLHRSLRAMDGVRDMSLLSYNNGIAIVSLESTREIDPKVLEESVSHAMSRSARVEVHNELTMVVKLAEE